jgi:hypothetical protein
MMVAFLMVSMLVSMELYACMEKVCRRFRVRGNEV